HAEDLARAAADEVIWRWLPVQVRERADLERWIAEATAAEAARSEFPFAVIDLATGRAVGSTRYMDVSREHRGVEVGWTWYGVAAQGTAVNPESKLLLLRHAFEDWGAIRRYLTTDSLTERSRAAIVQLGARYEGALLNHR